VGDAPEPGVGLGRPDDLVSLRLLPALLDLHRRPYDGMAVLACFHGLCFGQQSLELHDAALQQGLLPFHLDIAKVLAQVTLLNGSS